MHYELIQCNDKKQWDEFIINSPQNNIFCSVEFLDNWLHDYVLYVIKSSNIIILGIVICLDNRGKPIIPQFMYHGVLFGGLVNSYPNHKRIKKELDIIDYTLGELEKEYESLNFSLYHTFEDIRGFQWFNYHEPDKGRFKIDISYTGILDISEIADFDELLMNCRTVRRQEYRKCIKEGFMIEESDDINILDILHKKTFDRQDIYRTETEKFMVTNFARDAIEGGFGRLNICRDPSGVPLSASLFLYDNQCGYYLIGANDPDYRKYGSASYVVLDQINWCKENGLSMIDFVGINSPFRGDFKTSFNAMPKPYYNIHFEKT